MIIRTQICRLAAGALLAVGPAFAQTPSPAPTPTTPLEPAQNLSEKLDPSNGVIHPKEVDPAIAKPAPKTQDPNVIPPQATPSASTAPQAR